MALLAAEGDVAVRVLGATARNGPGVKLLIDDDRLTRGWLGPEEVLATCRFLMSFDN
jgi:hypothetical protein